MDLEFVTKYWVVNYCTNLTASDCFNEDTFEGLTQRTNKSFGFITEESAMDFYKARKNMLRVAGATGDYYTYPTTRTLSDFNPKLHVKIEICDDDGYFFYLACRGARRICFRCDGTGSHVNPAIDGHGISTEEFDQDPDFREAYFSGRYDVSCELCHGEKIIMEPDLSTLPDNFRDSYHEMLIAKGEARSNREREY